MPCANARHLCAKCAPNVSAVSVNGNAGHVSAPPSSRSRTSSPRPALCCVCYAAHGGEHSVARSRSSGVESLCCSKNQQSRLLCVDSRLDAVWTGAGQRSDGSERTERLTASMARWLRRCGGSGSAVVWLEAASLSAWHELDRCVAHYESLATINQQEPHGASCLDPAATPSPVLAVVRGLS